MSAFTKQPFDIAQTPGRSPLNLQASMPIRPRISSLAFLCRTPRLGLVAALLALLGLVPLPAAAGAGATAKPPANAKPATKPAKPPAKRKAAPKPPTPPAAATPEQLDAAERVFYGPHQCEFGQTVDVAINAELPGYVDVKFGKAIYVMKPVVSSTGAIRLEDVKGETLMVQITAKSMLMNVKAGRRLVDECISAKHLEAGEAAALSAAAASAAATSAAAAAGASAPAAAR